MTTEFIATQEFLTNNNVNGTWRYGYSTAGGTAYDFIAFDSRTQTQPRRGWSKNGYFQSGTPCIWLNEDAFPAYGVAGGQLSLHPGPVPNGDYAILRFVAPTTGGYRVQGQFYAGDRGSMSGRIVRGRAFDAPLQLFEDTSDASQFLIDNVQLAAGETLDFVVGNNGNYAAGNTPVSVDIRTTDALNPRHDAAGDFQTQANAGTWTYGYSQQTGAAYAFIPFDNNNPVQATSNSALVWTKVGYSPSGTPAAWKNIAATTRYGVAPQQISLHPGPLGNGDVAILRYTAPATRSVRVSGSFLSGDTGRMCAYVVLNGQFASPLAYFPETTDASRFDFPALPLSIGDRLDFVVGNNGNYASGNTPVRVIIESADGGSTPVDFDAVVASFGLLPPVQMGSSESEIGDEPPMQIVVGEIQYTVTAKKYRAVKGVLEQSYLQDLSVAGVWPGQIVQGAGLLRGDPAAVGPFARVPGTVEIVTEFTNRNPVRQSERVEDPTSANVNAARRNILTSINADGSAADLSGQYLAANTLKEVGLKLDLKVEGAAWGIDANARLNQEYRTSTVVAVIRQTFYTVNFAPLSAGVRGFWDTSTLTSTDLGRYARQGNPPLYVDSVKFGRFIVVTATASFASSEMEAAFNGHMQYGSVGLSGRQKQIINESRISIYTVGVVGRSGFQKLAGGMDELDNVFKSGLDYHSQTNPGAPIAFSCRHLTDNSEAKTSLIAEYTRPLSVTAPNVAGLQFFPFDGPGGGTINTAVPVNPGDVISLAASGTIRTGWIVRPDCGPEGLIGWNAPADWPLPSVVCNCLIMQITGEREWHYVGIGQSITAGVRGRILLGFNDDNPYNGDPAYRLTVKLDVERANAGAAGVFV